MATYQPGLTDQFPDQPQFSPDYSFLSRALSTRQNQYDRGFEVIHSLNSSLLNSRIENSDNNDFRKNAFNKINGDLKTLSTLDLSRPENIQYAHNMFNPLLKDSEMMRDIQITKAHDEAQDQYNNYANSPDADKRALANPVSQEYINMGRSRMRDAKRGDGSIFQVSPHEFVPFEDISSYLDKAANEDKLVIESNSSDGKYLRHTENGEIAKDPFEKWAFQKMGNRFDKQLQVTAEVQSEKMIRGAMSQTGFSRTEVMTQLGEGIKKTLLENDSNEAAGIASKIKVNDSTLVSYSKHYPKGIPVEVQQKVDGYKAHNAYLNDRLNTLKNRFVSNTKTTGAVFGQNMSSMLFDEIKKSTADTWGTTRAMTTVKEDVKVDPYGMERVQQQNRIVMSSINFGEQVKMAGINHQYKMIEGETANAYKRQQLIDTGKIVDNRSKIIGSKESTAISGFEVADKMGAEASDITMTGLFASPSKNSSGGAFNTIVNNPSQYNTFLNKLSLQSHGGTPDYDSHDKALLDKLTNEMSGKNSRNLPQSAEMAQVLIHSLGETTINRYNKVQQRLSKNSPTAAYNALHYGNGVASAKTAMQRRFDTFQASNTAITNALKSGMIDHDKVTAVGRFPNGDPIYHVNSPFSTKENTYLNDMVPVQYRNQTTKPGDVLRAGLSGDQMMQIMNSNNHNAMVIDGKTAIDLSKYNAIDMGNLFGKSAKISMDAGTQMATVELNMSPGSKEFSTMGVHKDKSQQSITVQIPFDELQAISPELAVDINRNTMRSAGPTFLKNLSPTRSVRAPQSWKDSGFDFTVSKSVGRGTTISVDIWEDNRWKHSETNREDLDPGNSSNVMSTEINLQNMYDQYLNRRAQY